MYVYLLSTEVETHLHLAFAVFPVVIIPCKKERKILQDSFDRIYE
jgi:hypothetical protein